MHHEIGILIVFLLVFLFDTFLPKSAQSKLSVASCVLFGLYTLYCFFAPMTIGEAFAQKRRDFLFSLAVTGVLHYINKERFSLRVLPGTHKNSASKPCPRRICCGEVMHYACSSPVADYPTQACGSFPAPRSSFGVIFSSRCSRGALMCPVLGYLRAECPDWLFNRLLRGL